MRRQVVASAALRGHHDGARRLVAQRRGAQPVQVAARLRRVGIVVLGAHHRHRLRALQRTHDLHAVLQLLGLRVRVRLQEQATSGSAIERHHAAQHLMHKTEPIAVVVARRHETVEIAHVRDRVARRESVQATQRFDGAVHGATHVARYLRAARCVRTRIAGAAEVLRPHERALYRTQR